ncbi:hypothetical protein QYF61_000047 [Mycteria americana]|uniref:Uncharacterized protein n=1 Tax=Mycteria americana TaxID=33587 RepID=A0AAN7PCJ6_MYCAM|nr:hypothetical protein QYF61_000047 [Mycteria americana]
MPRIVCPPSRVKMVSSDTSSFLQLTYLLSAIQGATGKCEHQNPQEQILCIGPDGALHAGDLSVQARKSVSAHIYVRSGISFTCESPEATELWNSCFQVPSHPFTHEQNDLSLEEKGAFVQLFSVKLQPTPDHYVSSLLCAWGNGMNSIGLSRDNPTLRLVGSGPAKFQGVWDGVSDALQQPPDAVIKEGGAVTLSHFQMGATCPYRPWYKQAQRKDTTLQLVVFSVEGEKAEDVSSGKSLRTNSRITSRAVGVWAIACPFQQILPQWMALAHLTVLRYTLIQVLRKLSTNFSVQKHKGGNTFVSDLFMALSTTGVRDVPAIVLTGIVESVAPARDEASGACGHTAGRQRNCLDSSVELGWFGKLDEHNVIVQCCGAVARVADDFS